MKLYFVRHGQSKKNKSGLHQGKDTSLSKLGKKQARIVAKRLQDKEIDVIFTSPFLRAKETAAIISKRLNIKIEFREELREAIWPTEIIGLQHTDPESIKIRNEILENKHDPNYSYSDEESFNELKARIENLLEHLVKKHKNQNVLCVTHGMIQKVFVGNIVFEEEFSSKLYYKLKDNSWMENTGITEIDYSDQHGWVMQTWNDRTHL